MIRYKKIKKSSFNKVSRLAAVAKHIKEIDVLYLFGSAATKKISPLSDLDLAVLLNKKVPAEKYLDLRLSLIDRFARILGTSEIDLIILNQATPLLAYEVVRIGKPLFERNRGERIDYTCKVFSIYFDMQPFYQFHRNSLKARL